jgi:hypothetical protein
MDQAEFNALLAQEQEKLGAAPAAPQAGAVESVTAPGGVSEPPATTTAPEAPQTVDPTVGNLEASGRAAEAGFDVGAMANPGQAPYDGISESDKAHRDQNIGAAFQAPDATLKAGIGGMAEGIFHGKDFLFGETPEADKSELRKAIERDTAGYAKKAGLLGGFAEGIGQFAIGMIGVGKIAETLKVGTVIAEAAPKVASTLKAAIAGAVAFDPHGDRMSNLIQSTPLANPVNEWLSAKPEDSAALGRLKNALESIGFDAVLGGVFLGATKIWKAQQAGDHAAIPQAAKELDDEINQHTAPADGAGNADGGGQPAEVPTAEAGTASPEAAPSDGAGPTAPDVQAPGTPDAAAPGGIDAATGKPDATGPDGTVGEEPRAGAAQSAPPGDGGASLGDGPATDTPSAGQAAVDAGTQINSAQPRIRVSDEDTAGLVQGMEEDAFATAQFGGWYHAIEAGHVFGRGEKVPWQKLNIPEIGGESPDLQNFVARVADVVQERVEKMGGGATVSDAKVEKVVGQMASMYNLDPATIIGVIQRAGKDANTSWAHMEAGYLLANRMLIDGKALAMRIGMGDFTEFGSMEAAVTELRKRLSIAGSVYGSARSISSNAGRALRRMHTEFAIDPAMLERVNSMDASQMVKTFSELDDARQVAKALNSTLWQKGIDALQFLYVNNLVSGFKTQLTNFVTNSYMLGVRPLERIIGGVLSGNSRVVKEAMKQYMYMGNSFSESFRAAGKAFLNNESVLAPHKTDVRGIGLSGGATLPQILAGQKPWGSPTGMMANLAHISVAGLGLPTRVLGSVDELMKQVTYRSKLQASAYMDGLEEGVKRGMTGGNLKAYVETFVQDKLYAGFDDGGKALDPAALREAQIATFQQELLPGSLGRTLQNAIGKHPGLKLMVPFIKTPTNVMRYGWKMTPILNLAQTEYREMLRGVHGAEAKAQAIGQMSMGLLFMGSASYLASQGTMSGGGPSDPKAKNALMATGWQPYSLVFQHEDGTKTYVPLNRLDPIAVPMGIMVDLMDAYHNLGHEESPQFTAAVGALTVAMAKQFTSKTYLLGITQFMDAMMDPDRNAKKVIGQTVSNFVPYSAALRQINPDPYLHDARDITDKVLTTVPGLGSGVPLRYDPWGEPVMRPGLWSSDDGSVVDHEIQRMAIETGKIVETPAPVLGGVDLRELTLSAGENAYEKYQQLAGNPGQGVSLKTIAARLIQTERYQLAPDGDAGTKGTKLALLAEIVSKRREAALKHLKRDPVVRDAFRADDLKARAQFVKNKLDFQAQNKPAAGFDGLLQSFGGSN